MHNRYILYHGTHGHSHSGDILHACAPEKINEANLILRISSIFVVLFFSCIGVFFPLFSYRIRVLKVSELLHLFIKHFGAGVIIGTALIHLLEPAIENLRFSPCLVGIWKEYDFSAIIIMAGMLVIFLLKIFSLRYIDPKYFEKYLSTTLTSHTHAPDSDKNPSNIRNDLSDNTKEDKLQKQGPGKYTIKENLITLFMLELGIIFHSVIIGLTIAATGKERFLTLYIVLIFHQMFEGLSLGARIFDYIHHNSKLCSFLFALIYAISTPVSIAIGLLVKGANNLQSSTPVIVSGVLNALSSGILLYTAIADLLAYDFIFRSELRDGKLVKLLYAIFCIILGFAAMAITGRWKRQGLEEYCKELKKIDGDLEKVHLKVKGLCENQEQKCKALKNNVKTRLDSLRGELDKALSEMSDEKYKCGELRNECYKRKREEFVEEIFLST
ncbi:hypothetical protein MERGE_003217 [Pneumocystis wakefieldiae]|uniref:Zinc/iron permease n=1 Tax=Pneumocystis wakefieldiae TaxID=38082 RepID=A0A899G3P7_9ASCO|nr:hypothetical protein MERGE_003217 [Pneumocystis wakefieldiae]